MLPPVVTKEGRHLETSQPCYSPCWPCRAGIFHIKLLWHPETPNCIFSFLKYFTRRRKRRRRSPLCRNSPVVRTFEGGSQGSVFPLLIITEGSLHEVCDLVEKFLLSKVGCVYLGMHQLGESGNLMLESYIGNIPLQEWSRSYALYSLHLSVIWINWVLMLELGRCFSFHLTSFFSSSKWYICTEL